jgi:hypothetical protein
MPAVMPAFLLAGNTNGNVPANLLEQLSHISTTDC